MVNKIKHFPDSGVLSDKSHSELKRQIFFLKYLALYIYVLCLQNFWFL